MVDKFAVLYVAKIVASSEQERQIRSVINEELDEVFIITIKWSVYPGPGGITMPPKDAMS